MKTILLPTDFSENSWKAINYALQLFKDDDCKFYVMHALDPQVSPPSAGITSKRAAQVIQDSRTKDSKAQLVELSSKIDNLINKDKHSFETILVSDYFYNAVKNVVDTKNIELVVIGTKGATGLKKMTLGSNTSNLIDKLDCPIIAVPESATSAELHEIGFASDFTIDHYGDGLQLLKELASANNSKISVVTINNSSDEISTGPNRLILASCLNPLETEYYTLTDIPIDIGISAFSESRKLDMLVLITKKRSFFDSLFSKSFSKSVSHNLKVPILIFDQSTF